MENVVIEPSAFKVVIVYNGTGKDETVRENELVGAVLKRALELFHVRDRQHAYGLFKAATGGTAIDENLTVKAAGIAKDEELYLREKQVVGG